MIRALLLVLLSSCATTTTSPAPVTRPTPPPRESWTPTNPPASLPRVERRAAQATRWKLKNGLSVIVVEQHDRPVVSLRVVFPSGSSSDDAARAGATWFSLALLGMSHDVTSPSGEVDFTEKALRKELVERGATFRSGVDLDGSFVGIDGPARDTRPLLERLADAVKRPRQSETSFGALLLSAADDIDDRQLTDPEVMSRAVLQLAFGDEEAGAPRGTAESLSRIGLEEIIKRQASLVHPRGATLLIVGDVDPTSLRPTINSAFEKWTSGEDATGPTRPIRATPVMRKAVTLLPRPAARTTILCAARPLGDVRASDGVISLAADVMSRRLTTKLREEATLTYDVSTGLEFRAHNRGLVICTRFPTRATQQGLELLLGTIDHAPPPTPAELELSRVQHLALLDRTTSFGSVSAMWLSALLTGRTFDAAALEKDLRAATDADVAAAWKSVTSAAQYQLVTLGDRGSLEHAINALKLGTVRTPTLKRIDSDFRVGDVDP